MFQFTKYAEKKFLKFDTQVQTLLRGKLQEIQTTRNFTQIKTLTHFEPATHRLRIGDYRLILEKNSSDLYIVLDVGHRRDIYQ